MKAVLIGTDLMYREDGNIVPLEINTNVGIDVRNRVESIESFLDLTKLLDFIRDKGIKRVAFGGGLQPLSEFFRKAFLPDGIELLNVDLDERELLEDSEDILIIRTEYSDTAIIDDYCADKVAFLKLTEKFGWSSEFIWKGPELECHGQIETIPDNNGYPNFIVKFRYPTYDWEEYPKLFRFNSIEALREYVESDAFEGNCIIQPYNYNEDLGVFEDSFGKSVKVFRNLSLFVLDSGNLNTISLGTYTKVSGDLKSVENLTYNEEGELVDSRKSFVTPKRLLFSFGECLGELEDEILIEGGDWKAVKDLEEGDEVQSIVFPSVGDIDLADRDVDYNISYEELQSKSEYGSAKITSKMEALGFFDCIDLVFEDGTTWKDVRDSSYLSIDPEDGSVRMRDLNKVVPGDTILVLQVENLEQQPRFEQKKVQEIVKRRQRLQGYQLSLTQPHIFISRTPGNATGFASIEHNDFSDLEGVSARAMCSGGDTTAPIK